MLGLYLAVIAAYAWFYLIIANDPYITEFVTLPVEFALCIIVVVCIWLGQCMGMLTEVERSLHD